LGNSAGTGGVRALSDAALTWRLAELLLREERPAAPVFVVSAAKTHQVLGALLAAKGLAVQVLTLDALLALE
jgi:hypothetical protein